MTRLHDMIEMVLDHPETYIKRRSVQRLYAFLNGYLEGHPDADDGCLTGFNQYVENHYCMCSDHNWADLIAFKATGNAEEIELFQKHFSGFIATKENVPLPQLSMDVPKLYDLITTILKRPELYIGRCSVQRLYAFLSGFLFENEAANDHCLDGFEQYIAARYRITAGHTWADIIELFSNTDHGEIQLFHKYFDQYIQTQQQGFRH